MGFCGVSAARAHRRGLEASRRRLLCSLLRVATISGRCLCARWRSGREITREGCGLLHVLVFPYKPAPAETTTRHRPFSPEAYILVHGLVDVGCRSAQQAARSNPGPLCKTLPLFRSWLRPGPSPICKLHMLRLWYRPVSSHMGRALRGGRERARLD